jgi:hypothetical protein
MWLPTVDFEFSAQGRDGFGRVLISDARAAALIGIESKRIVRSWIDFAKRRRAV